MGLSWYEPRRGTGSGGGGIPRDVARGGGRPGEPGRTEGQLDSVTGIPGFGTSQACI